MERERADRLAADLAALRKSSHTALTNAKSEVDWLKRDLAQEREAAYQLTADKARLERELAELRRRLADIGVTLGSELAPEHLADAVADLTHDLKGVMMARDTLRQQLSDERVAHNRTKHDLITANAALAESKENAIELYDHCTEAERTLAELRAAVKKVPHLRFVNGIGGVQTSFVVAEHNYLECRRSAGRCLFAPRDASAEKEGK